MAGSRRHFSKQQLVNFERRRQLGSLAAWQLPSWSAAVAPGYPRAGSHPDQVATAASSLRPTRPTLSQFKSHKIHPSTFPNYIKFADPRIRRLLNCQTVSRALHRLAAGSPPQHRVLNNFSATRPDFFIKNSTNTKNFFFY